MRCIAAKRTCGGYDQGTRLRIHQYDQEKKTKTRFFRNPFSLIPRKCSLPVREPVGDSGVMPEDILPIEISDEKSDEYALRAFFYEYRLVSTDQAASRGFLSGLERTLQRLGSESNLAQACRLVAGATYGIKLRRPVLTFQSYQRYHELLASLSIALHQSVPAASKDESILVAMLLGLYEVSY